MIKLKNVSTERLITFLKYDTTKQGDVLNAYLTLNKHSIRDYQKLKDMIENGRREFQNEFLISALESVEENVRYANQVGIEPALYTCNNYDGARVDKKTLKVTDRKNSCGVLLYKSPMLGSRTETEALMHMQINEAKDLLGKIVGHSKATIGNNAFIESMGRFGEFDLARLRDSINFYEAQVLRQAEETDRQYTNLFLLNKNEKFLLVRDEIKSIVKYLVDNAEVCVWGEFTPAEKMRIMKAVSTYSGYENQVLTTRMIDTIANYTTLSELKSGVVKQKTLDRFIIK